MIRGLIHRLRRRETHQIRVLVVLFMLFLLAAQLVWWVVFFEMNARRSDDLRRRLDGLYLAAARDGRPAERNGRVISENGVHRINPVVLEERESRHARDLIMLVSESVFLLLVICYGSYRVIRSIHREFQLNEDRNMFIDSVSHELKTPIASVLLNLQTLIKRKLPEEQRRELLDASVGDIHRLDEQVSNLLTAGAILRTPDALQNLHAQDNLDAGEEIRAYVQTNAARFAEAGGEIELDLRACPPIRMNPDMFEKILSNLVQNSIQYAGGPVRIHISLRPAPGTPPDAAILRLEDDGPGLPEAELEKVFQPLYRLRAGNRPVRGTGMGLYIVREIVAAAGGSVRASSRTSSQGTGLAMEIRLPSGGRA